MIAVVEVPTGSDCAEGQLLPCSVVNIVSAFGCVVVVEDHTVRKLCGSVFLVIEAAVSGCVVVTDADAGADLQGSLIEDSCSG